MKLILLAMFYPRRAAEAIRKKPRWLLAFLMLACLTLTLSLVEDPQVVRLTLLHLPASVTHEGRLAVAQSLHQDLFVRSAFLPVRLFIGWVGFTLLLFYSCKAWSTNESVRLSQLFSLEVHAEGVMVLAQLAMLLYTLQGDPPTSFLRVPFGIDLFLSPKDAVLEAGLNSINLFSLWYVVTLSAGISTLYRISGIKAFISVAASWVFLLFFKMGIMHLLRETFSFNLSG